MNKYKIRFLQLFFLIASVLGVIYYGLWPTLLSIAIYAFLEIFVGNATLHRYYGHRSFEMAPWKETILRWLAHHIGVGSVLGWAGHHRWHHKYSDTEHDLHSPTVQGIWHILFGVWDANIPRKMVSDLLKDQNLIWWHKNYFKYHMLVIVLLAILSPFALVFVYALPNLLCLCSGYVIAILPHRTGEVKNDWITEVLTFGEGFHLNHHNDSSTYRFSKYDLTAFCIERFLKN